jgi:KaiC/GvpD/RAD55 family RecA-like ATPase
MKPIDEYFKKNQNVVFLCRESDPITFTLNFLKTIPKNSKVLYVTTNKSFPILSSKFQSEKIDFSKWFFIDCISSSLMMAEKSSKQCVYLTSPESLVDLAMEIDGKLTEFDIIIFDNVSGLLTYNGNVATLQFLNSLMAKVRQAKNKAVYLLFHDTNKEVMEDLSLFADKVEII